MRHLAHHMHRRPPHPALRSFQTARFPLLKLRYDELLSNVALNFNPRPYVLGGYSNLRAEHDDSKHDPDQPVVGRCRLTVSKPELKARLVSVLETKM